MVLNEKWLHQSQTKSLWVWFFWRHSPREPCLRMHQERPCPQLVAARNIKINGSRSQPFKRAKVKFYSGWMLIVKRKWRGLGSGEKALACLVQDHKSGMGKLSLSCQPCNWFRILKFPFGESEGSMLVALLEAGPLEFLIGLLTHDFFQFSKRKTIMYLESYYLCPRDNKFIAP